MSVQVVGLSLQNAQECKDKLSRLSRDAAGDIVAQAAMQGAQEILEAAQSNAPVLKKNDPRRAVGNLKSKIKAFFIGSKPGRASVGVGVMTRDMRAKTGPFYAAFVELGTAKDEPQPYLRPAFDSRKDSAAARCMAYFKAWLDDITS
jgi:HK97 gp10 family phage protein